ncbi:hypothetical protein HK096_011285, partial [Nowakowskiella sp. JEL0078]
MAKSHCNRGNIQYGVSSNIGRRSYQQDDYVIRDNFFGLPDCYLFAVFDGHGSEGAKVSGFAKKMLPELLLQVKDIFVRDPVIALKNVFAALNAKLNDTPSIDTYMSGTTAVVVIILSRKMVVCCLGDSKAVLGQRSSSGIDPVQLTTDHNCTVQTEYDRVISFGSRVDKMENSED